MNKNTKRNSLLLFLTASIWGMAFVSQSKGMDYMQPLTFNGVRCIIGMLSLLIYIWVSGKVSGGRKKELDRGLTLKAGLWCGLAFTAASTLQQIGIQYTTVGKAGFITTLYIIFVPLAGIFFKQRVRAVVWFAAVMAAAGMYLLCMTESLRLGKGDILVLLSAVVFAAHIMLVDYYAPKTEGVWISCIQFAVCGAVCGIGALIWEQPALSQLLEGKAALLYAGVLSCGVAYTLQIVGQKGMNPTAAALILSLESVVATISGWAAWKLKLLGTDQSLTGRQLAGCVIVFAAVILVQLPDEWLTFKRKNT